MDTSRRVLELLGELDRYRARYRSVAVPGQVESINVSIARRARRVETIRRQVTELLDEMAQLESEVEGLQRGYEALLVDALDRVRREHAEGWSPSPVTGFRLWEWRDGGLFGAWEKWPTVVKETSCRHPGELPHSNERCGRLGCGVYATKSLDPLLTPRLTPAAIGYAVGVVEMTGKVVEHEHGYRGATARATKLVLGGERGLASFIDPPDVAGAFRNPDGAYESATTVKPDDDLHTQLRTLLEGRRQWTSETRSA